MQSREPGASTAYQSKAACFIRKLGELKNDAVFDSWGNSCRSIILCIISDTVPLLDLIHKRSVMFVRRCLQSESVLVKSVANYGVCHGRMLLD